MSVSLTAGMMFTGHFGTSDEGSKVPLVEDLHLRSEETRALTTRPSGWVRTHSSARCGRRCCRPAWPLPGLRPRSPSGQEEADSGGLPFV